MKKRDTLIVELETTAREINEILNRELEPKVRKFYEQWKISNRERIDEVNQWED